MQKLPDSSAELRQWMPLNLETAGGRALLLLETNNNTTYLLID